MNNKNTGCVKFVQDKLFMSVNACDSGTIPTVV